MATANSLWVRDLLKAWHKAASDKPDDHGRYFTRCLGSAIDVDIVGMPTPGAQICNACMEAVETDKEDWAPDHLNHVGIYGRGPSDPRTRPNG